MKFNFSKIVLLIMVVFTTMIFFSCQNDLAKIKYDFGENIPTAITKDFISLYSDSGRVIFQLEAPLREDYNKEVFVSEMPQGLTLTFYTGNFKVLTKLTADYGRIDQMGLTLRGNVVMDGKEKGMLKTELIHWDNDKKIIYTHMPVELKQPNRVIYGNGFVANENFSEFKVLVVTGTIAINE